MTDELDVMYIYEHSVYGTVCSACASPLHAKTERSIHVKTAKAMRMRCSVCNETLKRLRTQYRKHTRRACPACRTHVESALGKSEMSENTHPEAWSTIYLVQLGKKHPDNTYSMRCPRCLRTWLCHSVEERVEEELDALLAE